MPKLKFTIRWKDKPFDELHTNHLFELLRKSESWIRAQEQVYVFTKDDKLYARHFRMAQYFKQVKGECIRVLKQRKVYMEVT